MKHLASLAALAAIVPMLWFTVKPDGAEFCASGAIFRAAHESPLDPLTEINLDAAVLATSQFCDVVQRYPI